MRQTLRLLNAEGMAVVEVADPTEAVVAEASTAAEVVISLEAEEATFQAAEGA